jgi:hypothetical protein
MVVDIHNKYKKYMQDGTQNSFPLKFYTQSKLITKVFQHLYDISTKTWKVVGADVRYDLTSAL